MPIKDQTQSFRNRNGVLYRCWADVMEPNTFNLGSDGLKEAAKELVQEIRDSGYKAFYESQSEGSYFRVFAEQAYHNLHFLNGNENAKQ